MLRFGDAEPEFKFIGTLLLTIVGHPCECDNCTSNRQMAMASLLWLAQKTTPIVVESSSEMVGEGRIRGEYTVPVDEGELAMPEEIVDIVRDRLRDSSLSPEERALIIGFLESHNH